MIGIPTLISYVFSIITRFTPEDAITWNANIANFIQNNLHDAISWFQILLDKILYFFPASTLTLIIGLSIGAVVIRIVGALVNLVWW